MITKGHSVEEVLMKNEFYAYDHCGLDIVLIAIAIFSKVQWPIYLVRCQLEASHNVILTLWLQKPQVVIYLPNLGFCKW